MAQMVRSVGSDHFMAGYSIKFILTEKPDIILTETPPPSPPPYMPALLPLSLHSVHAHLRLLIYFFMNDAML